MREIAEYHENLSCGSGRARLQLNARYVVEVVALAVVEVVTVGHIEVGDDRGSGGAGRHVYAGDRDHIGVTERIIAAGDGIQSGTRKIYLSSSVKRLGLFPEITAGGTNEIAHRTVSWGARAAEGEGDGCTTSSQRS